MYKHLLTTVGHKQASISKSLPCSIGQGHRQDVLSVIAITIKDIIETENRAQTKESRQDMR